MEECVKTLLALSLAGSLLAAALLLAHRFLGKRLPSTFYYYAWLLVLLRLVVPLPGKMPVTAPEQPALSAPAGVVSVPAAGQTAPAPEKGISVSPVSAGNPETVPVSGRTELPRPAARTDSAASPPAAPSWSWGNLLAAVWAAGALLSMGRYVLSYFRLLRAIRRSAVAPRAQELEQFRRVRGDRGPELLRCPGVKTPMLVGTFRPMVVLPDREYSPQMLGNVFLHELTHYRRRDILYKWFAVAVYSVHWFNPMMLLIRARLDRDCEMSCDEFLLRRMAPADKKSYGETLLTLAADRALPGRLVATTFATEKKTLKERLEQIMTYRKMGKAAAALLLCAAVLLCAFAGIIGPTPRAAAQEETESVQTVRVSTVEEFLAAIAPDTKIVLAPGEYNLTQAQDYGRVGGDYYHWESTYDGYELVITDVSNLTIAGEDAASVTISTEPRYANVLHFGDSTCVYVENITVGHTKEQGSCIGGVLYYQNCADLEIQNARLFGCGVKGVELYECRDVHVDRTDIYECSVGCVTVSGSYNVLFENSKFYNCALADGVFEIYGSREVAVINSEVYGNYSDYSEYFCAALVSSDCPGVYLGGLDVHDNVFDSLFSGSIFPVTVENCRFEGGWNQWTDSVMPVSPDGRELTAGDLASMQMRTVSWTAAPQPEIPVVEPQKDGKYHVTNVDELLAAIRPDATIYLEPGEYDLTTASTYAGLGGDYYRWESTYDGYELVIRGADNLTIEAADPEASSIVTQPRYANVLRFEDITGLVLRNVTAGHTPEQGSCIGGVLRYQNCTDLEIQNARLFGCGVKGVELYECQDVHVDRTDIYECSLGCVTVSGSRNVLFENSKFYNCALANGVFEIYGSREVAVINSEVYGNYSEYSYAALVSSDCPGVYLGGLDVHDNVFEYLFSGGIFPVTVESCRFYGGGWRQWTDNVMPVSPDGRELTADDLASMQMRTVSWQATPQPEIPVVEPQKDGKYHVTNVDEFLAAIRPDATIYLEPGEYDLTTAFTYAGLGGDYYRWESTYDGYELVIQGADNLTIEAADPEASSIVTQPRYANVLRFEDITGLVLRNFTAGHTPERGECAGGVVLLSYVDDARIEGCRLFGCGIVGVQAFSCENLTVTGCQIYECSNGGAWFYDCHTVRLEQCYLRDIGGPELYADPSCTDMLADGQPFPTDSE